MNFPSHTTYLLIRAFQESERYPSHGIAELIISDILYIPASCLYPCAKPAIAYYLNSTTCL
ncbi:MAG: hypothetical protein K2M93_09270 [Muribaculaceae bacterium]|nr:hypothetical protein [Muribaculaceae bacterium]